MSYIQAKFIRYNANANDADIGDCVRRSISYGLRKPYTDVRKELTRYAKKYGGAYNNTYVFNAYLRDNGVNEDDSYPNTLTVDEFCSTYPQGTYICLCGKPSGSGTTHMVCIVDGDYIDSWNSGDWIIRTVYPVTSNARDNYSIDMYDIVETVYNSIEHYCSNLTNKNKGFTIYLRDDLETVLTKKRDDNTFYLYVLIQFDKDVLGEEFIKQLFWSTRTSVGKQFPIKINPAITQEANITALQKSLKQRVYDFLWEYTNKYKAYLKLKELKPEKFIGDKDVLAKLPNWCIPHMIYVDFWPNSWASKYEASMKPLPGDPRIEEAGNVSFYADTLTELKDQLAYYKEDFSRLNYDY